MYFVLVVVGTDCVRSLADKRRLLCITITMFSETNCMQYDLHVGIIYYVWSSELISFKAVGLYIGLHIGCHLYSYWLISQGQKRSAKNFPFHYLLK